MTHSILGEAAFTPSLGLPPQGFSPEVRHTTGPAPCPAPDPSHLAGSREYACVRCSHGGGGGGCGCGRRCGGGCTAGVRRGAGSCGPGCARQGPEDAVGRGSCGQHRDPGVLLAGSRPGLGVDPVLQVGLFISTSWDAVDVFQFGFLPAFALSQAPPSNLNTGV